MTRLYAIGEVLIDFVSNQKACKVKDATTFEKVLGGAPANVALAVARLGGKASLITQVGKDGFGDYIMETLGQNGVDTSKVYQTEKANTGLAFVSVQENGERDFTFFRNPSADLLLDASHIREDWFKEGDYLHFGSVDLVESPMKHAHEKAIKLLKQKNGIISFDPNVRLSLWSDPKQCKKAILEFLPLADIVKISDEELAFITGDEVEETALASLFVGDVQVVIYTKGKDGAQLLTKEAVYEHSGFSVKVEDTTGAGDSFMGSFLYLLVEHGVGKHQLLPFISKNHDRLLTFANAAGALTTTGKGALSALPDFKQVENFIQKGADRYGTI